jgi:hypothetical protein
LEAVPWVKGISASQNSPGWGIVVKTLVLRDVAVQEGTMVARRPLAFVAGRLNHFKLPAASVNPESQLGEVGWRQLLEGLLDFLNLAHAGKISAFH